MGAISKLARRLHAEGNSVEKILDAIEMMEDGAKPTKRGKDGSPRVELEVVLDGVHAQAVLDYRQRMRCPLTGYAAKLLAGEFSKCGDPNAAADHMIEKGWRSFKAEWLENEQRRSPHSGRSSRAGHSSPHEELMRSFGFETGSQPR